jgi:primosomal protein N' (replication factor Y)
MGVLSTVRQPVVTLVAGSSSEDTATVSDLFSHLGSRTAMPARLAQVAPEQGIDVPEGLTYAIPEEMTDLSVGDRVIVPLGRGNRTVPGYVLSIGESTDVPAERIKPIAAREKGDVRLPDELIELARWISGYYCSPLGMVLSTMLPAGVKHGTGLVRRVLVDLHDPLTAETLPSVVKEHRLPEKQAAVLGKALELSVLGKLPIEPRDLAFMAGAKTVQPVQNLVAKGLLQRIEKTDIRVTAAERPVEPAERHPLNADQQAAVDRITEAMPGPFSAHLLYGVTGSGKTEVYLRLIEEVVASGRSAIVLVPEIGLTPQTAGRFIGRLGARVAVLHSGLTAAQRHEQWLIIRDGFARVVVGARSAVFAPAQDLGLIVVDEEADTSYKQDQVPRYHARDIAVRRAQALGIPVVLGSATPSLESYHNAVTRRAYELHRLPRRVADLALPKVELVDLMDDRRKRYAWQGKVGVNLLSLRLEQALRQTIDEGGQAILLLNRRGYANYIACPDQRCGWQMRCDYCDAAMVYHRDAKLPTGGYLQCHYCGFENRLPRVCPVCGRNVTVFGLGTQRVEDELTRKFGDVKLLRIDSDAMRTGADYQAAFNQFRRGDTQLLIGTQMIAKGLDFPNVRLVGVISADTALNLPDFRAAERSFQLVAQVAGRCGRSAAGGRVIVQTFTPDHPAIQYAAEHDYEGFAEHELGNRERLGLPPVSRMARIVVRDRDLEKAHAGTEQLAQHLSSQRDELNLEVAIRGPTPARVARIGGYWRFDVLLIASGANLIQRLLGATRSRGMVLSDAHMAVDVDPVSLL